MKDAVAAVRAKFPGRVEGESDERMEKIKTETGSWGQVEPLLWMEENAQPLQCICLYTRLMTPLCLTSLILPLFRGLDHSFPSSTRQPQCVSQALHALGHSCLGTWALGFAHVNGH